MKLNADVIMALEPGEGWTRARVEELLAKYGGEVEHEVLLRDSCVPVATREALGRLLLHGDDARLRFYACDCIKRVFERDRAAGRYLCPQDLAAVELALRLAKGEATDEDLATAESALNGRWNTTNTLYGTDVHFVVWSDAGCAAQLAAVFGAGAAKSDAYNAQRAASESAAQASARAARKAEQEWQVKQLIELLAEKEKQESPA